MDEIEARAEAAVRLNALIRRTGQQVQQLLHEYAHGPGATVQGLAFMRQDAIETLEKLCQLERRLLGEE